MTADEPRTDDAADEAARRAAKREYNRLWRERNAEHVRQYRKTYNDEHREEHRAANRESMRRHNAKERAARERRERRRVYSREYYAKNKERYLEAQREARARRKTENPDQYLALAKDRQRRWRQAHREEQNAKVRERYEQSPELKRARSAAYYEENRDAILERHRQRWADNHDELLARQREYTARERRRRQAGLPPRRLHRVPIAERRANGRAADIFFSRIYDQAEIETERRSARTNPEELAWWRRDCARARADHYRRDAGDVHDRLTVDALHPPSREVTQSQAAHARAEEEARMDAIARSINDRLRQHPRTTERSDSASPHQPPLAHGPGLSR